MPTYTYYCHKCNKKFELFFSMKDYVSTPKCNLCNSSRTSRSYIDDAKTIQSTIKKHATELKTVGDLANRNRDRMSQDQQQELYTKHNEYKEAPSKPLPKGMNRVPKSKKIKWT